MKIQATIITQSFKHIVASSSLVMDQAYDLMKKMYPELASVVAEFNYEELKSQLLNSLIFLVDHFDEEQEAVAYLQTVGKKLRGRGLKPEYFDEAKDVMIRAISSFLNEKWTPKAKEQWNLAFEFINYHVVQSAQIPLAREYLTPIYPNSSEQVEITPKTLPTEDPHEPQVKLEPEIKSQVEEPSPEVAKPVGDKEVVRAVDEEFADIFAQFEPQLEAIVSLSPEQIEQIKQGASSHARALVSKHWEESFKDALEDELTSIEEGDKGSKSDPEAA